MTHPMRCFMNLVESMNLTPVAQQKTTFDGREVEAWASVFPREWSDEYVYDPNDPYGFEYDKRGEEPPKNPAYRPDLDMNLSNANMRALLDALGFDSSGDDFLIPIDQFINVATHWLRRHLGKRSGEIEPTVDQQPGKMTMVDLGRREGYLNEKIVKAAQIAREGKARGATHVGIG